MSEIVAAPTPTRPSRRDILFGGAMAATAGLAWARSPRTHLSALGSGKLEKVVPTTIGSWRYESASGIILPPPDDLARLLYDQQLSRSYVSDRDVPIMLVMAYGSSQGGMLQVHRPEICYPASGFRLTETATETLALRPGNLIPVRTFTATGDTRVEQVLYWTRIGDALPTGWTLQRLAIMRSNLAGYIPDGLLVRISTAVEDGPRATAALDRFARTMLAAMTPSGRRVVLGSGHAW